MDLEYITEKYPIGTVVNSLVPAFVNLKITGIPYATSDGNIWVKSETYNALLYRNGSEDLAEIISSPSHTKSEFLEGEYIVCLSVSSDMAYPIIQTTKPNWITKQSVTSNHLQVLSDVSGRKNGCSALTFDKRKGLLNWRYATKQEIRIYELINASYDVTKIDETISSFVSIQYPIGCEIQSLIHDYTKYEITSSKFSVTELYIKNIERSDSYSPVIYNFTTSTWATKIIKNKSIPVKKEQEMATIKDLSQLYGKQIYLKNKSEYDTITSCLHKEGWKVWLDYEWGWSRKDPQNRLYFLDSNKYAMCEYDYRRSNPILTFDEIKKILGISDLLGNNEFGGGISISKKPLNINFNL